MALTINTNIASLTAQRNLSKTSLAMNRSLQRLSSGLRINSAKDDAAGLAISDRMTSQIRGLNQAARNANDGISVAQTAEGALGEMTNILQRIRELAVQSANSTNTSTDRSSLNTEVQQLITEYDRIAAQTEFNGTKVLTGAFSGNFQVGADVGQSMGLTIDNVQGDQVGTASIYDNVDDLAQSSNLSNFASRIAIAAGDAFSSFTINGVSIDDLTASTVYNNSSAKVDAINEKTSSTGVTAFSIGNAAQGDVTQVAVTTADGDVVINGVSIQGATTSAGLVSNINLKTADHGVYAKTVESKLILVNTTGAAITVKANNTAAMQMTGFSDTTTTVGAGANGAIVLSADVSATNILLNSTNAGSAITGSAKATQTLSQELVSNLSVSSANGANLTMVAVDEALVTIDTLRSKLGAVQNRLESTIANLANVAENLTGARSRILDADIAFETAGMTKNSILQQAGTAILAQANQQPQLALQLLG